MAVDAKLLEMLRCPNEVQKEPRKLCLKELKLVKLDGGEGLQCDACKLVYPIKDDIPVMLVDEAKPAA